MAWWKRIEIKKPQIFAALSKEGVTQKFSLISISQKVFQTPLLFFISYAGTISGMGKEKKPSLRFSRSIFPTAHSTADLVSPKSKTLALIGVYQTSIICQ
jgi:hypothetical protein